MASKTNRILIRPIRRTDFPRLREVLQKAFKREQQIFGFDSQRFWRNAILYSALGLFVPVLRLFRIDLPTLLVVEADDKVVGEVHLVPCGKGVWTIDSLAVDPDYTGRDFGFNLIKESVRYASEKLGNRVVSSIRADNLPALRIAKKLGYRFFEERLMVFRELNPDLSVEAECKDSIIREMKPKDVSQVFNLVKAVDSESVRMYGITSDYFAATMLKTVSNHLTGLHSKSFVAEANGKIHGYANVVYTSPLESARIESFHTLPTNHCSTSHFLLGRMLSCLKVQGIKKVTANINVAFKDTKELFLLSGFVPVAYVYGVDCIDYSAQPTISNQPAERVTQSKG